MVRTHRIDRLECVAFPKVGIEFGTDWVKFCLRLGGSWRYALSRAGDTKNRSEKSWRQKKESWRCKERTENHILFTKLRIMKFSELPVAVLESYQQAQTDISKLSFLLSFTSIPLYTPLYTSGRSSKLHNPQDLHISFKTIALAIQYPRPTQHDQTSTPWWGKGCIFSAT